MLTDVAKGSGNGFRVQRLNEKDSLQCFTGFIQTANKRESGSERVECLDFRACFAANRQYRAFAAPASTRVPDCRCSAPS